MNGNRKGMMMKASEMMSMRKDHSMDVKAKGLGKKKKRLAMRLRLKKEH